jgi:RecA-family ATPase
LTPENPYAGIDIDEITPLAQSLLERAREAGAYVERSPSGRGWHIIGQGSLPRGIGKGRIDPGVEAYSERRYLTFTGQGGGDPDVSIQGLLDELNARTFGNGEVPANGTGERWDTKQHGHLLDYIQADDYETWVRTGMALKAAGAPLAIWVAWSRTSDKFPGEDACRRKWGSFHPQEITLGSVYLLAQEGGWDEGAEALELFDELPPEPQKKQRRRWRRASEDRAEGLKPPEWLIPGVMEVRQLGLLIGHRSVGKTFVAIDMVAHLVNGEPWNGRPCRPAPVAYFLAEGQDSFARRLAAYEKARGIEVALDSLLTYPYTFDLATSEGRMEFARTLADMKAEEPELGLVVLDTWAKYALVDAIDPRANTVVVRELEAICRKHGVAAMMLVHVPKAERAVTDPHLLTARGTSALENDTHIILACTHAPEEEGGPRVRKLALTRAKDVGIPFELSYCINSCDLFDLDEFGEFSSVGVLEYWTTEQQVQQREEVKQQSHGVVLEAIRQAPKDEDGFAKQYAIWEAAGQHNKQSNPVLSRAKGGIFDLLEEMAEDGEIERREVRALVGRRAQEGRMDIQYRLND